MTYSPTRIRIILGFIVFVGVLFIGKLFFVQVIHGHAYAEQADRQYVTPAGTIFERGQIYFKTKDGELVSAASVKTGYKLAIVPRTLTDKEAAYTALAALMPIERDEFMTKANKSNDPYEEVVHHLEREVADKVTALKIPGVSVFKEKWRVYPAGPVAAHTIGFIAYKGDELAGRYGLERQYDSVLRRTGDDLYVNFFAEVFSKLGKLLSDKNEEEGDIITTIEPSVQLFLEKEMEAVQKKWSSQQTIGVIMNPKTGAIYAVANAPSFDLNDFSDVPNAAFFRHPLVENVYEMGSIIKPLIMSAGIDTGAVTAETSYFDKGSVVVGDRTIYNFDKKGRGQVNMEDVLAESLNTGMVYVSQHMKKEDMKKYLYNFGLGEKTGIDLPNETSGLLKNLDGNRDVEYANMSFGQGIALTPIETMRALAAVANGGTLVTPHLVEKIDYPGGFSKKVEYKPGPRVIQQSTSEEISRILTRVVDKTIQGGKAKLDRYSVAAKTGTAQIPNPNGGGYYTDRNLHSFVGYFPAYDPEFLVFMYTIYPKGARYSSETLAPPFLEITKFLINYYDVPPDREPATELEPSV